jgi:peroxiredoxin
MEHPNEWIDRQVVGLLNSTDWAPNAAQAFEQLRRRERATHRRRVVAGCAVTLAAGAMAFPATRAYADRCLQACVASDVGQYVWSKLGATHHSDRRLAPDFALPDPNGRTVRLSDLRGQVVVLNFWATWCPPCKAEIPWFVDFQRHYPGLAIVGVSMDDEGWDAVRPFIAKAGINYRIVLGGEPVAQVYGGLDSLPTTLIIDRTGRVAVTHVGLVSQETYRKDIEAVIAER